eukprot:7382873-Prymnesium_polylepis.1
MKQINVPLEFQRGPRYFAAIGERRAAARAVFEAKESGADRASGARAGVSPGAAESAGAPQRQQHKEGAQPQQPAVAPVTAPEPQPQLEAQPMKAQPTEAREVPAEPRVAAAAEPHKRQA